MNKLTYLLKNIIHKIDQAVNVEPITDPEIDVVFNGQIGNGVVGWNYKANAGFGTATETDFNNLTTYGIYWINPSTTTSNSPISAYGHLEVIRGLKTDEGTVFQRFSVWNTSSVYERLYVNSTWQAWRQVSGTDLYKIGYEEVSVTVGGNNTAWKSVIMPSGRICLCPAGYYYSGTGNAECTLYAYRRVSDTEIQFAFKNWTGSQVTLNLCVHYIYYNA